MTVVALRGDVGSWNEQLWCDLEQYRPPTVHQGELVVWRAAWMAMAPSTEPDDPSALAATALARRRALVSPVVDGDAAETWWLAVAELYQQLFAPDLSAAAASRSKAQHLIDKLPPQR